MDQQCLWSRVLMGLAGFIMMHDVGLPSKLLCLVSWGLYHNASSKGGERTEHGGYAVAPDF